MASLHRAGVKRGRGGGIWARKAREKELEKKKMVRTAVSQGRAPGDEHVKIITLHVKTRSPLTKDGHFKMAA